MKEDIIKEFQDKIEKEFVYLKKGDDGYCLAAKTVAKEEGKSFILKALASQKQETLKEMEKMEIPYNNCGTFVREGGYNQALEDIKKQLTP